MDSIDALLERRGKTHGRFEDYARITGRLKDVIAYEVQARGGRGQTPLSHEQREAVDMIMHKIGRLIAGDADFHDHWDDIAGYARLCSKPVPLNPRVNKHLDAIDERLHECPDLDQEYPICVKCDQKHRPGDLCFKDLHTRRNYVTNKLTGELTPTPTIRVSWEDPESFPAPSR